VARAALEERKFAMSFARRLKTARLAAGYSTPEKFAEALGVSVRAYRKWESGRTLMPHEYLRADPSAQPLNQGPILAVLMSSLHRINGVRSGLWNGRLGCDASDPGGPPMLGCTSSLSDFPTDRC
jgi:hypothetical protein